AKCSQTLRGLRARKTLRQARVQGAGNVTTMEPKPPKITKVRLGELSRPDPRDVLDGDLREGERYTRVDFTARDLSATSFTDCEFESVRLLDADLTGAHFTGSRWHDVDAPVLRGPRSSWRNVIIERSRIG